MTKNLPAKAGDAGDVGSIPGFGRSPGEGDCNPLWYSCLKNPIQRWVTVHLTEVGYSGVPKSQTWLSTHAYMHSDKSREAPPYYKYAGDRTALAFGQPCSGTLFLHHLVRMLLGEKMRTQSDQWNNWISITVALWGLDYEWFLPIFIGYNCFTMFC